MDPTKEQYQILCKFRESATDTLDIIRQALEKENMRSTRKVQTFPDRKIGDS
jgi:hypothetical protein